MATTINTSADLIALLRDNKEFREEVRRFVLTDELFAIPDVIQSIDTRLSALEDSHAKMLETQQRMSALLEHVVAMQAQMAERQDRTDERLDALEASSAKMLETQQRITALLEQVTARQDRTDERLGALEESHAKMLETQQRITALLEHVVARQDQMAERQDRTDERLDRMDKRMDGFDARFDEVDARFDAVDARFKEVDARFDEVDARFDAVDAKFVEVDAKIVKLDNKIDAVDGKVESLTRRVSNVEAIVRGEAFERRMYSRLLPRLPMEYDITRVHAVSVDPQASVRVPDFRARDFENNIESLRSRGAITDDDVDNINNTDMVVQSLRRADRSRLWFAVQATVTIRDDAITRAHAGAEALRKAFGQEVIALTYGRRIAEQQRRLADELGVATLIDSWEREDDDTEEPSQ